MLAPMQYTVCVRQDAGFCGVQWAPTDTTSPDTFNLDDTETIDGLAVSKSTTIYVLLSYLFITKLKHDRGTEAFSFSSLGYCYSF